MEKLLGFVRESRAEVKRVTWPTRRQLWYMTAVVVVVTIVVAAYLGLCDAILTAIISRIIR